MILVVILVSLLPAYVFSARPETQPDAEPQTAAAHERSMRLELRQRQARSEN